MPTPFKKSEINSFTIKKFERAVNGTFLRYEKRVQKFIVQRFNGSGVVEFVEFSACVRKYFGSSRISMKNPFSGTEVSSFPAPLRFRRDLRRVSSGFSTYYSYFLILIIITIGS
jgi:hypothetical protein